MAKKYDVGYGKPPQHTRFQKAATDETFEAVAQSRGQGLKEVAHG